eukprot:CAMPEP_0115102632 /NCGR_PEP_ID=MMETSP0227-20121206/34035_1 /TAXON_ID=89957 /ORGANISM="Polarella glacialis, Strain CCMP 1383" /LENGTH=65 /DNA_ID=CAMNT_0002498795 /DNA_START=25 /DNA_END=222 /DNA_ORIENTATION=+
MTSDRGLKRNTLYSGSRDLELRETSCIIEGSPEFEVGQVRNDYLGGGEDLASAHDVTTEGSPILV